MKNRLNIDEFFPGFHSAIKNWRNRPLGKSIIYYTKSLRPGTHYEYEVLKNGFLTIWPLEYSSRTRQLPVNVIVNVTVIGWPNSKG